MNAVLLAALLVQQTTVSASVSTENVRVGEEVVLTVEFRTHVSGPAEVEPLNIQRLELIGTNQSSVFRNTEDGSERHTTWTYRLRATRAGTGTIGPIRVTVGSETVATPPMDVTIEAVVQPATPTIAPRILRLVRGRLSPRAGEEAVVRLVTSRDTVVVGEQLDLIVMAWVSREVQSRMQTRPYLTPPTVDGAWTYPRTSFLAVVDSQRIGGELFDLFVHHQVVFPLVSGTLHATPATFSYNVPLRTSLLRRDSPREVQTDAVDVTVLEQPEAGKPDGFSGAAGQDLVLTMSADSAGFGVGNAGTVTATVSGRGNVSMWPEPIILWPEGLRVYPAGTGVSVDTARGLIGGSKTFSYLVAPDSVGAYLIPQASYHYFDVERLRYRTDRAEPVRLLANAVRSAGLAEFTPLPLLVPASRAGWQHRIRSLGPSTLVASILLVPLLAITWVFARGLFAGERPKRKQKSLKGFDRAAQDFHQKLQVLVRQETLREGDGLVAALRAAGVEAPVALHAARVRDRLRMARYGPPDATDIQELAAEVAAVIEALPPTPPRGGRFAVTASVFAFLLAGSAVGQAPNSPPEVLYEAGAFLAAAAEFESRARLEPHVEAHWFNLGAAALGAGEQGRARLAFLKARRIAPRDRAVHVALEEFSPVDNLSRRMVWTPPVTVAELGVAAFVLWVVGWLVWAFKRRRATAYLVLASALALAIGAELIALWNQRPVGVVVADEAAVREAPFGSAPLVRSTREGQAVSVVQEQGAWIRVTIGNDEGWILSTDVGRL